MNFVLTQIQACGILSLVQKLGKGTKMSQCKGAKAASLKRINEILKAGYAETLRNMTAYITVQCGACRCNFLFNCTSEEPKINHGIISDAHGIMERYQFRFPCPNCGVLLRVDEDEVELRVWAKPDKQHS